jgi:hypothetical protein
MAMEPVTRTLTTTSRSRTRSAVAGLAAMVAAATLVTGCSTAPGHPSLLTTTPPSMPSTSAPPSSNTAPTSPPTAPPTTSSTQSAGTSSETSSEDPSSTSAGADAAAYSTYLQVTRAYLDPTICQDVRGQFLTAVADGAASNAHQIAGDYRTTLFNADAGIRTIQFPDSARSDVNDLLQADKDEIAELDAFASLAADKLAVPAYKIVADDDVRAARMEELAGDLGHPVTDDRLPIQWYDDDLLSAFATLDVSFVQLDDYSTDLVQQEGAALVDGQYVSTFQHALGGISISPPADAQAHANQVVAASRALAAELSTDEQAADSGAAGRVKSQYKALVNAATALDNQLTSDMKTAAAPDHGCTGTTGQAASSTAQDSSTPESSTAAPTTHGPSIFGTGWDAFLPHGWIETKKQSGDELDLSAPDGGVVVISKPQKVSVTDPATVGKAEVDALTQQGYTVTKPLATGTWAGMPSFRVGLRTADSTVDAILVGAICAGNDSSLPCYGSVIDITVAVPDKVVNSTSDADVLDELRADWRWT